MVFRLRRLSDISSWSVFRCLVWVFLVAVLSTLTSASSKKESRKAAYKVHADYPIHTNHPGISISFHSNPFEYDSSALRTEAYMGIPILSPAVEALSLSSSDNASISELPLCSFNIDNDFVVDNDAQYQQTYSSMDILRTTNEQTNSFAIAWQSSMEGSGLGIYASIFEVSDEGDVQQTVGRIPVNTEIIFDQKLPRVAALNYGQFVVVFQSTVQFAEDASSRFERVKLRLFLNEGVPIGTEFNVSQSPDLRNEQSPDVAAIYGDAGGFAVTWIQSNVDILGSVLDSQLMCRIYSSDGTPRSVPFQVGTLSANASPAQAIASLWDGRLIMSWTANPTVGCGARFISAQIIDQNGQMLGPQFQVNDYSPSDQYDPDVTGLANGYFVITWTSTQADTTTLIMAQIFNDVGARLGPSFNVNQNYSIFQSGSIVTPRSDGAFLVLWSSFDMNGVNLGILGQLFDFEGSQMGQQFPAYNSNIGMQFLPASIIFPNNKMVLSWSDNGASILGRLLVCELNCTLSKWSSWSTCSKPCGTGVRFRTRTMIFPPLQGGASCEGPLLDEQLCNTQPCPDPICMTCLKDSCYMLVDAPLTFREAKARCTSLASCPEGVDCLVQVDGQSDRSFIVNNVSNGKEIWIGTWQGSNYGGLCLAMTQFGAIIVPARGCQDHRAVVCQVPKPSTCV